MNKFIKFSLNMFNKLFYVHFQLFYDDKGKKFCNKGIKT